MINLYFYKDSPDATQIHCKYSTSPCFRVYLPEDHNPIMKLIRDGKHILYTAWVETNVNNTREEAVVKVMKNNPLYPNHRVIKRGEASQILEGVQFHQSDVAGSSDRSGSFELSMDNLNRYMIVLANVRPEGFETRGIPCEQFINGFFTARNTANWAGALENLFSHYESRNLHPFFAYLDNSIFNLDTSFFSNGSNGFMATRYQGGSESENIDIHSFGTKSHQKLQDFFNGSVSFSTHPLDIGNYLLQVGGYFRDNYYNGNNQYIRRVDGLGNVQRRMASCLSLYEGDDSIFTTRVGSFKYFRQMFNALYRFPFFAVPTVNMMLTEGQTVYIDTRDLNDSVNGYFSYPTYPSLSLAGLCFKEDKVVGVDMSRTQQVLLEKMGWINICAIYSEPLEGLESSNVGRIISVPTNRVMSNTATNRDKFGDTVKAVVVGSDWQGGIKAYVFEAAQKGLDLTRIGDSFRGSSRAMIGSLYHSQNLANITAGGSIINCKTLIDLQSTEVTWL